jgi:SHS family lactate transporter-like MFS transporter
VERVRGAAPALAAAFLGWTLDAFDFFVVALSATAIAREFHRPDRDIALTLTVTLAFRPVGALIFGLLADRYGRRLPLMIDLVFYASCEVASGMARDYHTFLILRALFGIGMGGEWGVGASLAMEKVRPERRGLASGLLQEGYAVGYLLAAVAYAFVFPRWGWRPLFFLGGLPALVALFVRFTVEESEVWRETRAPGWRELLRGAASHWRAMLALALLLTTLNLSAHATQDMYPTFLERAHHLGPGKRAWVTALSMVGAIAGGLGAGALSDRIGRRRALVFMLAGGLVVVPLWAFAPSLGLTAAGAFLLQLCVQGAWGVVPAHLAELSPEGVRGFLPGFAYQLGVLASSGVAWFEATAAEHMSYARAMAVTAAAVLSLAAIASAAGRERTGARLGGGT